MCSDCKAGNSDDVSPWFYSMLRLYNLQMGGYPFSQNDLSLEEWEDLAALKYSFNKMTLNNNGK